MKIGIVCYLTEKIRPHGQGYYYRLYCLGEELIKMGHKVAFFAAKGSKTSGELITPGKTLGRGEIEIKNIKNALEKSSEFDIINIQMDHRGVPFDHLFASPVLHTIIYGNFSSDIVNIFQEHKKLNYSTISQNLRDKYHGLNWQGVIHNGLNLKDFKFSDRPANNLLFVGRIHPEKGPDIAIQAAKETGQKLIIAGPIQDKKYFNQKIKPELSKDIKYIGKASFRKKVKLFKKARAFVFPVCHDEGFGNTLIESLACGTPVIAYGRGAIPEIITQDKTGFICNNFNELTNGIKNINKIDRRSCRNECEKKFTVKTMAEGYANLYQKIINQRNNK